MDTDNVAVLLQAAAAGSLSAAARRLGITPMLATRRLAALERELGVRLLHRTTRSMSLTPEGEAFLPYAESLLESEAAGRAVLHRVEQGAAGLLRVSASVMLASKIILPLIPGLLQANPQLRIDLEMNDRVVDIIASGSDLAIRIGPLRDNSLIAKRIGDSPRVLIASPAYLEQHGTPGTMADLAAHDCLLLSGSTHWTFQKDGREQRIRVGGRFAASNIEGLFSACVQGVGIAMLAQWNVQNDLDAGRLLPIHLEDAEPVVQPIWAVYPSARQVLPKLRVFVAALESVLKPQPQSSRAR
jgi:DNA-binding transcriptional LysR family regulator